MSRRKRANADAHVSHNGCLTTAS